MLINGYRDRFCLLFWWARAAATEESALSAGAESREKFGRKKCALWAEEFYDYCTLGLNYPTSGAGSTCPEPRGIRTDYIARGEHDEGTT